MNLCLDTTHSGIVYKAPTPTYASPIGSNTRLVASKSAPSSTRSGAYRRWRKITQPPSHPSTSSTTFLPFPTLTRHFAHLGENGRGFLDASSSPQRMEVQIPSPSVFLQRSPVVEPAPAPIVVKKAPKPRPGVPNHAKKPSNSSIPAAQNTGVAKPKQSKSRNGTFSKVQDVFGDQRLRWLTHSSHRPAFVHIADFHAG